MSYQYLVDANGDATITGYIGSLGGNIVIPAAVGPNLEYTVTAIGEKAFYNNQNITGVTMPDKVLSIGAGAFENCSILQSVLLPDPLILNITATADVVLSPGLILLGDRAFFGCNLRKVVCLSRTVEFGINVFSLPQEGSGIWGYAESTAWKYAIENGIKFHWGFLVTFNPDGGHAVPRQFVSTCTDLPNPGIIIKPADPVKAGYEFNGWYTVDTVPKQWDFANNKVTADTTLRAKWLKLYKISAVGSPASYGVVKGAGIFAETKFCTLTVVIVKAGCKFVGWREGEFLTGKSSGGKIVSMVSPYSFEVKCNRSLTAVFEKNLITRI